MGAIKLGCHEKLDHRSRIYRNHNSPDFPENDFVPIIVQPATSVDLIVWRRTRTRVVVQSSQHACWIHRLVVVLYRMHAADMFPINEWRQVAVCSRFNFCCKFASIRFNGLAYYAISDDYTHSINQMPEPARSMIDYARRGNTKHHTRSHRACEV